MCDLGGLDNLIANTAFLQAREGDPRQLQRRRRSLFLPSAGDPRRRQPPLPAAHFASVCRQQPIGRRLFGDFLASVPEYRRAQGFLERVEEWELAEGEDRARLQRALLAGGGGWEGARLAGERAGLELPEARLRRAREEALAFLAGAPFRDFQASAAYERFLQWKALERQPVTEKHFYEFRVLGKGGYGEVCAIQVKTTGKMYACKKLDKKRLKKKHGEGMALLEKEILEAVRSPFVVTLAYAYETKRHLCLVMSLMTGGDLKFHIYNVGERGLGMDRVIFYSAQVTCGLQHLHSLQILYRDMKPENVLLDDQGNCRLSDLGLATRVREGKAINQKAGTNGYMAPEILKEENYSYPVDWFALGCSIYEMIAGRTPFRDFKEKATKDDVKKRTLEDEVKFQHPSFTEEAKNICSLLLNKKPEERLGSRGTSDNPRKHPFFETINFQRLEAGLVAPPFVPDPSVVYAKDIADITDFSEIRGIEFDEKDKKLFNRFATGAVPISWQEEIIETGLFEELNDPARKHSCRYVEGPDKARSGVCAIL
ncbi:rhodopsin kinase [Rhinatrema bivittatum]|uniref:rhodopsin kinase n=1 Tax=Rhinatrema bivittatum TaxID=194408 RepID=UPI0011282B53|nr:rhodopsin kinase [Rhinatrema bivittatum]